LARPTPASVGGISVWNAREEITLCPSFRQADRNQISKVQGDLVQLLPLQKAAAGIGAVILLLAAAWPLLWGLSVMTGMISYNWGGDPPPRYFPPMVLLSVAFGLSAILVGRRLMSRALR
jgi:hypothetical protein